MVILADWDPNNQSYKGFIDLDSSDLETAVLASAAGYGSSVSERELVKQAVYDADGTRRIANLEDLMENSVCGEVFDDARTQRIIPGASQRAINECRGLINQFEEIKAANPGEEVFMQDGRLFVPSDTSIRDWWEEDQLVIQPGLKPSVLEEIRNKPLMPGEGIKSVESVTWGIYDDQRVATKVKTTRNRELTYIFDAPEIASISKRVSFEPNY